MATRSFLVLTALLLGACANAGDPPEAPSPTSEPGTVITGVVIKGVEPDCLVLSAEDQQYLLLGADRELVGAGEVVLRGQPHPGQPTTCQQGIPFTVDEVVQVEEPTTATGP